MIIFEIPTENIKNYILLKYNLKSKTKFNSFFSIKE